MKNTDFIKQIILEELQRVKQTLTESVTSWPQVKKMMRDANIESFMLDQLEVFKIHDATLGDIYIYDDGSAILLKNNSETTWTMKTIDNTNSIVVNGQSLAIKPETTAAPKQNKYKLKKSQSAGETNLDTLQTALDWLGFIPGYGDIIDALNAIIYFARGKYLDGALSLVAIIPVVGSGIKLGLKGTINAAGGTIAVSRIWKKAAIGNSTLELAEFYRLAIESGKLNKMQLNQIAKKGDQIAGLLTKGKRQLKNFVPGHALDNILDQIDYVSDVIKNTTSIPIKQSFLSKVTGAVKGSKLAKKTLSASKFAFKAGANFATIGGYGAASNLLKKLGIGKREMKYLKDAMDLRFTEKISASSELTTAMFKSNKRNAAAATGLPDNLYTMSTRDVHAYFDTLKNTDPMKWKQVSNTIAEQAATSNNPYYTRFVENAFQQASNIFRPGTVLKAGYPEMFSKVFKLDSYRLSNPKNLDIVKNEIEDLAEKLGLDPTDDPQGVIMPAIFMLFNKFITDTKETIAATTVGGLVGLGASGIGIDTGMPGSTIVQQPSDSGTELQSIKTDFKNAEGTTTERLDALLQKGYDEAEIYALKKLLDIE